MKKLITLIIYSFCICAYLENIPVTLQQPDNTSFNCFATGDEFYARLHDVNGYTIIQNQKDGYYYYAQIINGGLTTSIYKVHEYNPLETELESGILISREQYLKRRGNLNGSRTVRDAPTVGTINNINIFIRFSDESEFSTPRSFYDEPFNDPNGPSIIHYYQEVSYDNLEINTIKKSTKVAFSIFKIEENEKLFSIILNDLSKNNKLEQQFNFEKSAQSATSLVAMLSHEIKNPLSGIKGAGQLIKKRGILEEKDLFLINLIDTETNRIIKLLNSLEGFTDERPIIKKYANLNQVLRYVITASEVSFNKKNILFIENYDPSLPKVFGNKEQLIQLFLNLIKNSCEVVEKNNGVIKITTKYEHSNFPLTVYIEDNGNGVPEHLKDNLFDTFITNKVNGRGLGLSISAKIVQSHYGSIIFDSEKGKTVFKVMFKHKQ